MNTLRRLWNWCANSLDRIVLYLYDRLFPVGDATAAADRAWFSLIQLWDAIGFSVTAIGAAFTAMTILILTGNDWAALTGFLAVVTTVWGLRFQNKAIAYRAAREAGYWATYIEAKTKNNALELYHSRQRGTLGGMLWQVAPGDNDAPGPEGGAE